MYFVVAAKSLSVKWIRCKLFLTLSVQFCLQHLTVTVADGKDNFTDYLSECHVT